MAEESAPRTDVDTVTVLLVDDHPMFLDGLRGVFLPQDGFRVVGVATSAEEAVAVCRRTAPQVVVLDLGLPDGSGIDVTRRMLADRPDVKVLVLSMSDDDENVLAAMRAGAHGYLVKGADREEILTAMRTVARGGAVFSPRVALRLRTFFDSLAAAPGRSAFPELTPRELEILGLLAAGLNYRQIARKLTITDKTVRNHVTNIFAKLQVNDRAQAIVRARNAGLGVDVPPPRAHG
ncbi:MULTISPECIES: response regulator transcription factor [unclassified Streptomyces]|uniref:response regulator n=1 Tax=unclassified Streptomyces TaxID=2593676 RepID=UPI001F5271C3|nr:response regulator transcription factor [Streptomyces sp. TSRI0107]